MFGKKSPVTPQPRSKPPVLTAVVCGLVALLAVVGCGKKDEGGLKMDIPLAKVGETVIMSGEYIQRLARQEEKDLPKDEQGQPLDMGTLEGKREFLQAIINKDLMYQKAIQLGYLKDGQIAGMRRVMIEYEGGIQQREERVNKPSRQVSEEELQECYAKMGLTRVCRFVITNFIEDAQAARELALTGADWEDVAHEYHDGGPPPGGVYRIEVPYGRYGVDFENPVFAVPVGGVTEPILTSYGYWVLKIDQEISPKPGTIPPIEEAKAEILDMTYNRKMLKNRNEFIRSVREKYKFEINEEALWLCYQGLPEGEALIDPETKEPPKREDLLPLTIDPADMDMWFYRYETDEGPVVSTLGDYKAIFDRMNVFQRPKKSELLGATRNMITQEMEKALLNREAEAMGYFQHPDVLARVKAKMEEILVNKLFEDVVNYDERLTPEQMDEFWAEHSSEYALPERRNGKLVVCRNEEEALKAREAAAAGTEWPQILLEFGTDQENKSLNGRLEEIPTNALGETRDVLFALTAPGELSEPFAFPDGRYGVVRLEEILPPRDAELSEFRDEVANRMLQRREEEVFQKLLSDWTEEFGVTVYEENLAQVPSWEEILYPQYDNLIERRQPSGSAQGS